MGVLGFGGLRKHCSLSGLLLQLCCASLRCCDCRFGFIVLTLDLFGMFLDDQEISTGVGDTDKLHIFLFV